MTLNDIMEKIAVELTKEHDKEFRNNFPGVYEDKNMIHAFSNEERDHEMMRKGYEKAMDVVRQTLYKIVSDEIKSKNLDFLL